LEALGIVNIILLIALGAMVGVTVSGILVITKLAASIPHYTMAILGSMLSFLYARGKIKELGD